MNNDIKEINKFKDILNYYKVKQIEPTYCEELITAGELQTLLDYITNLEEIRKEHNIMKQFIYENGLWERFLNDDRFLKHLRSDDSK